MDSNQPVVNKELSLCGAHLPPGVCWRACGADVRRRGAGAQILPVIAGRLVRSCGADVSRCPLSIFCADARRRGVGPPRAAPRECAVRPAGLHLLGP